MSCPSLSTGTQLVFFIGQRCVTHIRALGLNSYFLLVKSVSHTFAHWNSTRIFYWSKVCQTHSRTGTQLVFFIGQKCVTHIRALGLNSYSLLVKSVSHTSAHWNSTRILYWSKVCHIHSRTKTQLVFFIGQKVCHTHIRALRLNSSPCLTDHLCWVQRSCQSSPAVFQLVFSSVCPAVL